MIVKFLNKFGKLVKSITSIAYIPVDVEPVEGSGHLLSSGAGASISSNFAPNYTKQTYEANSYVMQGGVLYTNENAIETAEDWNPAHWTQTTVAEMMAGGSTGYKQVDLTLGQNDTKTIPVGQKEDVYVECQAKATDYVFIQIAEDCTDAVIRLKRLNNTRFASVQAKRGDTTIPIYGKSVLTGLYTNTLSESKQVLLSYNFVGEHGEGYYDVPTDFSEVGVNNDDIINSVNMNSVDSDFNRNTTNSWIFVVKGRIVVCLPE